MLTWVEMTNKKNVLITHDDGIDSLILASFVRGLSEYLNVFVMVPEKQRSTVSHSLAIHKSLRATSVKKPEFALAQKVFKLNGSPADSVKVALRCHFENDDIQAVFSGINLGSNLGMDTTYSGTVAGAMEGNIVGKPAVSLSVFTHDEELDFSALGEFSAKYLSENFSVYGDVFNISLP